MRNVEHWLNEISRTASSRENIAGLLVMDLVVLVLKPVLVLNWLVLVLELNRITLVTQSPVCILVCILEYLEYR